MTPPRRVPPNARAASSTAPPATAAERNNAAAECISSRKLCGGKASAIRSVEASFTGRVMNIVPPAAAAAAAAAPAKDTSAARLPFIFRESIAAAARRVKRFIRKLSSKKSSMYMFLVQPHRPRCRGFLLPSLRRTGTGVRVPYPPEAMITPKARLQCRSRGATGGKEWGIKAECGMRRFVHFLLKYI